MNAVRTVVVSGSSRAPSRTLTLAQRVLSVLEQHAAIDAHVVDIAGIGRELGSALDRSELPEAAERAVRLVESAELLIAATPVYRGSYSAHFKHLFDLVDQDALFDVPVILAATGGSDKHCLVIEHALRPLFAFLQAHPIPIGVYSSHADFSDGQLSSTLVEARIATAARQALRLARPRSLPAEQRASGATERLEVPLLRASQVQLTGS